MDVPPPEASAPQPNVSSEEMAALPTTKYSLPEELEGLPLDTLASRTFWYSLANLGYGMFFALNNATLTLLLKNMGASGVLISS